ncbi:MAG: hypothetical protein IJO91_08495, partial [Oscillospiraceae bacterium]|nr:hypothetical protein [Oscillospiraceae bacterium]
ERRTDALLKKMDELELQKSELEEQLRSAELAQAHIPTKQEIMDWFDKLKKVDGAENALQKQVINTFVHKVFLWDEKAIIVLTLNNTQETVTFEQIRDYESLAEEKQKPLTEISASGSCYKGFGSPDWT